MKKMILLFILFTCLAVIIYPQNETKKLSMQLERILQHFNQKLIPEKLSGKKKNNYPSSGIYKPSVEIADDSLKCGPYWAMLW